MNKNALTRHLYMVFFVITMTTRWRRGSLNQLTTTAIGPSKKLLYVLVGELSLANIKMIFISMPSSLLFDLSILLTKYYYHLTGF